MGLLSGDWYVEGVHVGEREGLQMVRLVATVGEGEGEKGIRVVRSSVLGFGP